MILQPLLSSDTAFLHLNKLDIWVHNLSQVTNHKLNMLQPKATCLTMLERRSASWSLRGLTSCLKRRVKQLYLIAPANTDTKLSWKEWVGVKQMYYEHMEKTAKTEIYFYEDSYLHSSVMTIMGQISGSISDQQTKREEALIIQYFLNAKHVANNP